MPEISQAIKSPTEWASKDEPMTNAQTGYLKALCEQIGEPFFDNLTKAQASARISELAQKRGAKTAAKV